MEQRYRVDGFPLRRSRRTNDQELVFRLIFLCSLWRASSVALARF
jgi:hypothetical protein